MALRKNKDLRKNYPIYVQVGLILTLGLLITAFNVDLRTGETDKWDLMDQEIVEMEEVLQTEQIEEPPPPPRPPVPVEVPNDEALDDVELDLDASLDLDEPVANTPPPPPGDAEEEDEEPEIFVIVENMPELIGGLGSIQQKIRYPDIAKKAGVEGRVFVQFVVDEEGNVLEPEVTRGIGAGCDEEALRAVRQAKFKPGKQRGKPVRVKMSLPITFRLK